MNEYHFGFLLPFLLVLAPVEDILLAIQDVFRVNCWGAWVRQALWELRLALYNDGIITQAYEKNSFNEIGESR